MSGLDIIRAIQSVQSPALDRFFLFMTDLHSETIYLLVLPLLLWLYDKRFARYMTSVFLLGYWSNDVLKALFHTARPYEHYPIPHLRTEPTGAFPSGHSQNPLMFWGAMAMRVRKAWVTALVAVVLFLIGLSRLYIGVHWPLDIIGGWTIGALMLWAFSASYGFWAGENITLGRQLLWAVAIPVAAAAVSVVLGQAPALSTPKAEAGELWITIGAYLGMWVGTVLEDAYVRFDPRRGSWLVHAAKIVIGVVLVMAVKEGFKLFLPATALGDLIRYFCVAFGATFVAPWIFVKSFAAAPPAGQTVAR